VVGRADRTGAATGIAASFRGAGFFDTGAVSAQSRATSHGLPGIDARGAHAARGTSSASRLSLSRAVLRSRHPYPGLTDALLLLGWCIEQAFKRRRNELAESPVDRARSTLSSRGYMSSRGSAMSSQRGATAEKNFWPPERTDPWSVAVEDHNLELRAQHQASLEDFSRSNTAVQEWLVDKQAELRKPTGQGRDQMDRVMFFLATGREAVQKAGSGEASLADIKDAFENQKARRRINSRWAKAIEASHKDLQWISKYRQRDVARQRAQAGSQRVVPLRAGGEVPAARGSGAALPRSGSTQSLKAAAEAGPHSEKLGDEGKQDLPKGADSAAATQPAADDTTDSVSPTPTPPQQQMAQPDGTEVSEGLQQPAAPSYMASNESWRRRNDGFCRGRALREQLASR
jgi:hypothetical protein